jgi:hypothetical protein
MFIFSISGTKKPLVREAVGSSARRGRVGFLG